MIGKQTPRGAKLPQLGTRVVLLRPGIPMARESQTAHLQYEPNQ